MTDTGTGGLYAAWAAANAEIENPLKDGKGNYGKYLTLDALLDSLRPTYSKHGLVWWQTVSERDGRIGVTTHLAHRSGDRISFGTMYGPVSANVQQMGSVRTYLSRYSYLTAMGIAGGEDDDGAVAAKSAPAEKPKPATETVSVKRGAQKNPPSSAQMKMMGALLRAVGMEDREAVLAYVSAVVGREVQSRNDLTSTEAGMVLDALNELVAVREGGPSEPVEEASE